MHLLQQDLDRPALMRVRQIRRGADRRSPAGGPHAAPLSAAASRSGISAAGVSRRAENGKTCTLANAISRTNPHVSSNSCSVSPGKPTITSVVRPISGISSRNRRTARRYCCRLYQRFIRRSTVGLPLCSAMCRCGAIRGRFKMEMNRSSISCGPTDVTRKRSILGLVKHSFEQIRQSQRALSPLGHLYVPTCVPVRTTSR